MTIIEFFKSFKLNLIKMVIFTSDGAAVMLECNVVKLRDMFVSHLMEYGCIAHKEAAGAHQTIAYFMQLENVIMPIQVQDQLISEAYLMCKYLYKVKYFMLFAGLEGI